ncbi:MAG: GHKL domain-containing protein [Defluviitaleaceae bacterium]|nr:GHKL domain-containing protein [Defluviitaleaceae bacterium]
MIDLLIFIIYRSPFSSFIVFTFLFALAFIGTKTHSRIFISLATIIAVTASVIPVFNWSTGSMAMFNLAVAFMMTATVLILNFLKLSLLDYAILFSSFVYIVRFVGIEQPLNSFTVLFGIASPTLYVFIVVLAIYKIKLKHLKGNLFYCWFTCVLTFINGYGVSIIFVRYVVRMGQARATRLEALFVWGVALLILVVVSALIIYLIKRLFKKHFDNINNMGKAYPQIERFFIYNSIGIIFFMGLLHYINGLHVELFMLFAMALQVSYLVMVFRITWLKDNLKHKAIENQNLVAYSSGLEKNIDSIKYIKHDVKNIFLTMGNFVKQSNNAEIQEFYSKKISPFAIDEIAKNDLYSKLAQLDNEQLKAFIFYKISQAVERSIDVDLDITTQFSSPKYIEYAGELSFEFIDLVRILGILLDNAIEECMEISEGTIHIKISQNDEMTSYMIKNTIRKEIKGNGIKLGESTKGKGRGNGLVSIRNIIEKYDFVVLNSYFSENYFVQNLIVYI